nr:MAG TPA: hypothetical protein [Caudoviricetes sp.]
MDTWPHKPPGADRVTHARHIPFFFSFTGILLDYLSLPTRERG